MSHIRVVRVPTSFRNIQFLKSMIHQDLMVRDFLTVAEEENKLDFLNGQPSNQDNIPIDIVDAGENIYWEGLSDDNNNNNNDDTAASSIDKDFIDLSGSQF